MTTAIESKTRKGMLAFGIVWIGQVISFIGSGMSSFALGVWVYQKTGSITQFALTSLFIVLPRVVFGPLAGSVGQLIGVGTGRGAGLLFISAGLFLVLTSVIGSLSPRLLQVENELSGKTPKIVSVEKSRDMVLASREAIAS